MAILNALSERLLLMLTDLMLSSSSWLPLIPGGKKNTCLCLYLHLDSAPFLAWEPSLSRCSLHLQEQCHWKGKLHEPVFSLAFNPIAQQST